MVRSHPLPAERRNSDLAIGVPYDPCAAARNRAGACTVNAHASDDVALQ